MKDRRWFVSMLTALAAALTRPRSAKAQAKTVGVIQLPPPFDKQKANFAEVYVPAGQPSKPHKHAGFVLGYVLEGELRFQITGQPERILRAGEIFYEPPGVTHLLGESANPDRPARFLAIVIADADNKSLTWPA
jgi:quercetin dioxygenase-like cupin family protein